MMLPDDDHLAIVHPGQYALDNATSHILESINHTMTDEQMEHVLANPFWLACLQLVLDLRLPRPVTHDITLVTHTTTSRLHSATATQCAAWPGSMVVAVYLPLLPGGTHVAGASPDTTLHAQLAHLATRAAAMHSRGACALHMLVYAETLPHAADTPPLKHVYEYPINALRNRALLAATTELVMLVDADMIPGPRWWLQDIMQQSNNSYVAELAARCRSQRAVAALLPFALDGKAHLLQVWLSCSYMDLICGGIPLSYRPNRRPLPARHTCSCCGSVVKCRCLAQIFTPTPTPSVGQTRRHPMQCHTPMGNRHPMYAHPAVLACTTQNPPLCSMSHMYWACETTYRCVMNATGAVPLVCADVPTRPRLLLHRGWYVNKLSCVFQLHAKGWSFFAEPAFYLLHVPHIDGADKRPTAFARLKHHLWLHTMGGDAPGRVQAVRPAVSSCALSGTSALH